MPSPTGVLALWANLSIAYAYETESLTLAEATDLSIQMASMVTDAKMVPTDDLETPFAGASSHLRQVQGNQGGQPRPR